MFVRFARHLLRVVVVAASLGGALTATAPSAMAETAKLAAGLTVPAGSFDATVGVWVDFTLTNQSSTPVSVLVWNTPFEGIRNDIFRVTKDGEAVDYKGPMVKRAKPQPSDYLTLAAGESKTTRVDLAVAYAIAGVGAYQVRFDSTILDVAAEASGAAPSAARIGTGAFVPLTSADVTLRVATGRVINYTPVPAPDASSALGANTYRSCSATQKNQLTAARANAYQIARVAYLDLAKTPTDKRATARRTKLWFGTYTASHYALISSHFSRISTALKTAPFTFDCSCTQAGTFAYVFPDEPYTMYLCAAFWPAPTTGADSKAGTLVHEASHYLIMGGTKDHVYGQSGAKALAISNFSKAVMNADNHEYFAENTPSVAQP